ncbi:MAG: pilus assembly protein [Deltaproteobacteria bacterium]|nr:pilus assembly protein [Deltaproteobacteria bacterium]
MHPRRAQSALETLLLVPILLLVLGAMVHLFRVTYASRNAHVRAREHVLHGSAWLGDQAGRTGGTSVFDEPARTYRRADPGAFRFESFSGRSFPGLGGEGDEIATSAVIMGGCRL